MKMQVFFCYGRWVGSVCDVQQREAAHDSLEEPVGWHRVEGTIQRRVRVFFVADGTAGPCSKHLFPVFCVDVTSEWLNRNGTGFSALLGLRNGVKLTSHPKKRSV